MSANNWTNCPSCERADTFREDYEIGVWEGDFEISYSGVCLECGFILTFKYKKDAIEQSLEVKPNHE